MTTPDYSHREMTYEEQRQYENAPHRDPNDNVFHEYRDEHGNVVRQYAMDPENITVTPGHHVDWNTVVTMMVEKAERRMGEQIPYTHSAVFQFQSHAHQQIAQFVHDNEPDAGIGWGSLVEGLTSGLFLVFAPELEAIKYVVETAVHVFSEGLEVRLEQATSQFHAAKAKLENGVNTLTAEIDARQVHAVDAARRLIRPAFEANMAEYRNQPLTMDMEWIEEMVHWFGFPERTESTVTGPILHELNQRFDQILHEVQAQLAGH